MLEAKQVAGERASTEARVLKLICELLSELGSERALRSVNLQASLDKQLLSPTTPILSALELFNGANFDLVINSKTAATLGLDTPRELLAIADEVIE
jgi:hypothetical protein